MSLNELARRVNQTARDKGFWDADRNVGEMLMLAVSELSEALEEHRNGRGDRRYELVAKPGDSYSSKYKGEIDRIIARLGDPISGEGRAPLPSEMRLLVEVGMAKPEGFAVEVADCIIRCLDILHSRGVDIDAIVAEKMAYNASRPHKHGKAY